MKTNIKGKVFEVAAEPADYWGWITEGRYNREFEVYDKHLKPEHTFVDVGAWVGGHSLYASTIAGRVIAIEPDPVAFAIAAQNLTAFDIHQLAISNTVGDLKLGSGFLGASTTRANPSAGSGIGPWVEGQTCTVPSTTLRKFCDSLPDPLFIKIDVEGSEEDIFKDLNFFLQHKPTVLVELHPWWWKDQAQAAKHCEELKSLYQHSTEVFHNTWVLHD